MSVFGLKHSVYGGKIVTIHERIKHRREELGISATEAARMIGVSRATLYRYEKADISKIPSEMLDKISEIYNISLNELMGHAYKSDDDVFMNAMLNEVRYLSKDAKNQLLAMARFLNGKEKKK